MKAGLIDRIRSRGYWRINFQPRLLINEKLSLAGCRDAVEKNALNLRGWQYPCIPFTNDDQKGALPSGDYYEAWIDWRNHIEYWRSYRSHQFLHYLALREDWFEESDWDKHQAEVITPGQALGTGMAIRQITEIFEFLSRMGRDGHFPSGAIVTLSLENTKGRQLWVDDPQRMPFLDEKKTGAERIEIGREVLPQEFATEGIEIAQSVLMELFDHFGWTNPSPGTIRSQQEQLLSGRL
ncbi:hypothetical protein AAFG13_02975 [Bradyrhizobium sp. B124]|uniref:hypothetical protein n=1 Tax=Bradyrhizobium sp. B124 TaxID=3140245 RepID=UPI003182F09D